MREENCSGCKFSRPHEEDYLVNPRMMCRRNPPVQGDISDAAILWPLVKVSDWCGEFKPSHYMVTN